MERETQNDITTQGDRAVLPGIGELLADGWKFMLRRYDLALWYLATVFPALFILGALSVAMVGLGESGYTLVAGIGFALLIAAFLAAVFLITLALTRAATAEGNAKFWSSMTWAKEHFWAFLWVAALMSLVLTTGFVMLIIPGIILSVYLYFAQLSIIHHGHRGMTALRHSTFLVRENWWAVFGRAAAVVLVYLIVYVILQAILYTFLGETVGDIIGTALSFFGTIFLLRIIGRMYHSLVEQKPDFDPNVAYQPSQFYVPMAWGGLIISIVLPVVVGWWVLNNWEALMTEIMMGIEGPDTNTQFQIDYSDMSEEELNALMENYEAQLQDAIDAELAE